MGRKGNKRHLKSLYSPSYYAISKKNNKYTTKMTCGRHNKYKAIPLILFIRDKLKLSSKKAEIVKIINQGFIKINEKIIKDYKYPIGLNDVVSIDKLNKKYKISIDDKAHFNFEEIDNKTKLLRICKVVRKYKVKKDIIMLGLHDGTNIKGTLDIKINDSVIIDENIKINKVLPLKKNAECFVIDGVHVGDRGILDKIKSIENKKQVIIKKQDTEFETSLKNIIVIN